MMTFEEYVRLRGPALVRLARLLAREPHLGDDLAQEVLARAMVRWRRIVHNGDPDAYVRRMLVNANISHWRRYRSRIVLVAQDQDLAAAGDHSGQSADRDALWRLIVDLPARQRAALVLRFYEDLDDVAIANILDCSPVTVRSHVMRALDRLRTALDTPLSTQTNSRKAS